MKRIALVFVIAILLPASVLAVLAVRSVRDQELIADSQRAVAYQAACESRAAEINLFLNDVRVFYGRFVDEFVDSGRYRRGDSFHEALRSGWSQAAVGAVVGEDRTLLSPDPSQGELARRFLENHGEFVTGRGVVEAYQAPRLPWSQVQVLSDPANARPVGEVLESEGPADAFAGRDRQASSAGKATAPTAGAPGAASPEAASDLAADEAADEAAEKPAAAPRRVGVMQNRLEDLRFDNAERGRADGAGPRDAAKAESSGTLGLAGGEEFSAAEFESGATAESAEPSRAPRRAPPVGESAGAAPEPSSVGAVMSRNVAPTQALDARQLREEVPSLSRLNREALRFDELSDEEPEGAVSRILDGELHVLLWKRPESNPGLVFWTELDLGQIRSDLSRLFTVPSSVDSLTRAPEVSIALLDASGGLVAQTVDGFAADWSWPFVAAEVGQILPRWEVAAYLVDPEGLDRSARLLRIILVWVVATSLVAVAVGGFLIFRSVGYEMRMASRKTDFVSNVSHELKTPLTSIRMFSDLLASSETSDPEKTRHYSAVISKEAGRLGRLIHRLLDFSRLERGELRLRSERVSIDEVLAESVEQIRPQLEEAGLEVRLGPASDAVVAADRDGILQVFLNLLSNAGKYAAGGREIAVEIEEDEARVEVSFLDRGPGIPRSQQRRIFEKFYRIDDSIDSGIEGSGIGLALSHQIVERMGGELRYRHRRDGGSVFVVNLPRWNS